MIKKEDLFGKFVQTKGRNKEIQELAKKLEFEGVYNTHRDTTKLLIFINEYYSKGSLEFSNDLEYCKKNYKEITVEELLKEEMKQYTVSEQFIKEAHKAACSTWKTKLEEQFPEVFPRTYKRGDIFIGGYSYGDKTEWVLSTVVFDDCTFANFFRKDNNDGASYSNAIQVKDCNKITEDEIKTIMSEGNFKLKQ